MFVEGRVIITADALHEGPAPRVDGDAWYDLRAGYVSAGYISSGEFSYEDVRDGFASADGTIREHATRSASLSLGAEAPSAKAAGERSRSA